MCFGWLQVPEFMLLCPCDLVFVLEPVHSKKVKGRSFVRKGLLPVECGIFAWWSGRPLALGAETCA